MLMSDGWANGMDARVRCARTGLHRRDHHDHCASLCRAGIEPASPGGCTRRPSARGWRAGPCVREEGRMAGIIDPKSSKLHHDATATARRLGAASCRPPPIRSPSRVWTASPPPRLASASTRSSPEPPVPEPQLQCGRCTGAQHVAPRRGRPILHPRRLELHPTVDRLEDLDHVRVGRPHEASCTHQQRSTR